MSKLAPACSHHSCDACVQPLDYFPKAHCMVPIQACCVDLFLSFVAQKIIIDFALADLKKEEEEKAEHKRQVLAERIEPLEENYSLEEMAECMCRLAVLLFLRFFFISSNFTF